MLSSLSASALSIECRNAIAYLRATLPSAPRREFRARVELTASPSLHVLGAVPVRDETLWVNTYAVTSANDGTILYSSKSRGRVLSESTTSESDSSLNPPPHQPWTTVQFPPRLAEPAVWGHAPGGAVSESVIGADSRAKVL